MRRSAGLAVVLRLAGRRMSLRLRAVGWTTGTADGLCPALRARRGVAGWDPARCGECDDTIVSVGGVIIVVIAVRANELFAQFVKHGTYMLAIWCSLIRAGARGGLYANRIVVGCGFVVGVTAGSGLVISVCFIGVLAVSVFAEADVNVITVIGTAGHLRVIQLRRNLLHRTHAARFPVIGGAFENQRRAFEHDFELSQRWLLRNNHTADCSGWSVTRRLAVHTGLM